MKPRYLVKALGAFGFLASFASLGRAHAPAASMSWDGQTSLPGESVADLNVRANNSTAGQGDRARAVFTLFARHIHPESSEAEVHRVLGSPNWLRETHLFSVRILVGKVPVEMTPEDTVFCIHLFPEDAKKVWSPWVMYFRLSGRIQDASANAFLRGDESVEHVRLLEFALCFPARAESPGRLGRMERFSSKGIYVFDPGPAPGR
jgi:hypothetical protein